MFEVYDAKAYLIYTNSGSKNDSGGLRDQKVKNKCVKIFANVDDPGRCVTRLYMSPDTPSDM